MSGEAEIAALDAHLERAGSDGTLRRIYAPGVAQVVVDCDVRVAIRRYQPQELVSGIMETDVEAIMSPTPIARAQWPGGELPSAVATDPSLPRKNDKLIIAGKIRNIENVDPIRIGTTVVRINMRARG